MKYLSRMSSAFLVLALLISSLPATKAGAAAPAAPPANVAAAASPAAAPFVNAHAIIVIRHADIDNTLRARLGNQTPLLPAGEQRAKDLAAALKDAGVTRIITSASVRTNQTAAPLAEAFHIKTESPPTDQASGWIGFLAQSAKPTDTILLVQHHTIIPSLMAEFGIKDPPMDDATEFDRMYVILPDTVHHTYQVMRLRYGAPTPR